MAKTTRKGKTMYTKRADSWRVKSRKGESGFMAEHQDSPPVQTEALLAVRGTTHGSFTDNARISQAIKNIVRDTPGWPNMTDRQREALDYFASKICRICSGHADYADHWDDIAGYAILGRDK